MSNLAHQTVEKLQKNHGVLRGPQLGKQRLRPRLGILRVKDPEISEADKEFAAKNVILKEATVYWITAEKIYLNINERYEANPGLRCSTESYEGPCPPEYIDQKKADLFQAS